MAANYSTISTWVPRKTRDQIFDQARKHLISPSKLIAFIVEDYVSSGRELPSEIKGGEQ
jgi:hypothetical protein